MEIEDVIVFVGVIVLEIEKIFIGLLFFVFVYIGLGEGFLGLFFVIGLFIVWCIMFFMIKIGFFLSIRFVGRGGVFFGFIELFLFWVFCWCFLFLFIVFFCWLILIFVFLLGEEFLELFFFSEELL